MTITNEQAMQELLNMKRAAPVVAESVRHYDAGVLLGMTCAYWRAGIISYAQYQMLTGMDQPTGVAA